MTAGARLQSVLQSPEQTGPRPSIATNRSGKARRGHYLHAARACGAVGWHGPSLLCCAGASMRQCKSIARRRRRRRSKRTTCPWCVTHHRHFVACHRGLRCMCAPTVFPCNRVAAAARRRARHRRDPMRRMPCCALCSMRPAACTPRGAFCCSCCLAPPRECSGRLPGSAGRNGTPPASPFHRFRPVAQSACPQCSAPAKQHGPADAAVSLAPGARHPGRPHFGA